MVGCSRKFIRIYCRYPETKIRSWWESSFLQGRAGGEFKIRPTHTSTSSTPGSMVIVLYGGGGGSQVCFHRRIPNKPWTITSNYIKMGGLSVFSLFQCSGIPANKEPILSMVFSPACRHEINVFFRLALSANTRTTKGQIISVPQTYERVVLYINSHNTSFLSIRKVNHVTGYINTLGFRCLFKRIFPGPLLGLKREFLLHQFYPTLGSDNPEGRILRFLKIWGLTALCRFHIYTPAALHSSRTSGWIYTQSSPGDWV